jgi:hypothetical protein
MLHLIFFGSELIKRMHSSCSKLLDVNAIEAKAISRNHKQFIDQDMYTFLHSVHSHLTHHGDEEVSDSRRFQAS